VQSVNINQNSNYVYIKDAYIHVQIFFS